jgi:hypothetical protein
MNKYPAKLVKYLNTLNADQRTEKEQLYDHTFDLAKKHGFQSARFWAMRQIVSGLTHAQIEQKIQARIKKTRFMQ